MFLDDGKMLNYCGVGGSIPVYPNPLPNNINFTGFDMSNIGDEWSTNAKYSSFDGKYIWISLFGRRIYRFEVATGNSDIFSLDLPPISSEFPNTKIPLLFANQNIWLMVLYEDHIYKMDTDTLKLTKVFVGNFPKSSSAMPLNAIFDGKYMWCSLLHSYSEFANLVRIDLETNEVKGFFFKNIIGHMMIRTPDYLWFIGSTLGNYTTNYIEKINIKTMERITIPFPQGIVPQYSGHGAPIFDGKYIWCSPSYRYNKYIRINTLTDEITGHVIQGENIGDLANIEKNKFADNAFDGRYIWHTPHDVNKVLRLDTQTLDMKGYDIVGQNLGNFEEIAVSKFIATIFDGKNIWLMPGSSDRIVKLSAENEDLERLRVIEKYQTASGETIQTANVEQVMMGDSYTAIAPQIEGYRYIGYKLDNSALQIGDVVNIASAFDNHEITFVYEKDMLITEKFLNDRDEELQSEEKTYLVNGADYRKEAPFIDGYKCIGYKINDSELYAGNIVNILSVDRDYGVIFMYEKVVSGGGCNCDFTIIYPNNGTKEQPGSLYMNQRQIMENPFPGTHVFCKTEVLYNGKWGSANFIYTNSGSIGICAEQLLPDDKIILQTGSYALLGPNLYTGSSHATTTYVRTYLPCRVKVFKVAQTTSSVV